MLTKFILIFIFFTPEFGKYKDVVGTFDTAKECEKAKAEVLADAKSGLPKDFKYVLSCQKAKGISDTGA